MFATILAEIVIDPDVPLAPPRLHVLLPQAEVDTAVEIVTEVPLFSAV